jgi:glycosyltransferase involved in cell wall biosynthesis
MSEVGRSHRADFVVVTQYFRPERGAAQVRLGAIVDELQSAGHWVEVVTALPNYPTGRIFEGWVRCPVQRSVEQGVPVTRVWLWAAMGNGLGRIVNYLSFGVMSVVGLLRAPRSRWVLVEYPTLFGALPSVLIARLRRQKVGLIVADLWVDSIVATGTMAEGPLVQLLRRAERRMLKAATTVTAVTDGVRRAVEDKGVAPDRVRWLPNGADTTMFHPGDADRSVWAEYGVDETHSIVLYAGTHGFVHGLEVVLDAAEALRDQPICFLLVGGGSEKARLVADAAQRGLRNVVFHDPVDPQEVARLLRAARVALATVRDGELYRTIRSAKALPAMASGCPVVYSADDEGSRVVERAAAGIVTPPGDGAALAAAVRRLVEDDELAAELGRHGREWVDEHASWRTLVGSWLASIGESSSTSAPDAPVAWPSVGFVGIHAGRRTTQPVSQNEVLARLFESAGYSVRRASAVRRPLPRTLHQMLSVLTWWRVDLVVVAVFSGRSFLMAELATALARLTCKRVVLFLHGGNLPVYGPQHERRVRRVFDRADLVLAPSEFLASTFRSWGYDVHVIPNVVDVERYECQVRSSARPRLLWMRTFHEDYNPIMAVRVLARVLEVHPDARMTMAGADHGGLDATKAEAQRLGVMDRIEFPGYVDHEAKLRAFREHDVFLNTNRIDNMPVSVVEASLSGLVPVATAVGGVPAIVVDGHNGELVATDDDEDMARRVLGLLDDAPRFARMSAAAHDFGMQSSWPSVHRRWVQELGALSGPGVA